MKTVSDPVVVVTTAAAPTGRLEPVSPLAPLSSQGWGCVVTNLTPFYLKVAVPVGSKWMAPWTADLFASSCNGEQCKITIEYTDPAPPAAGDSHVGTVLLSWAQEPSYFTEGGIYPVTLVPGATTVTDGCDLRIAAADSSDSDKARADLVCTGPDDDGAEIDALLAGRTGLVICMAAGTYFFGATPVNVPAGNVLQGAGPSTVVHYDPEPGTLAAFVVAADSTVRNLLVNANNAGNIIPHAPIVHDEGFTGAPVDFVVPTFYDTMTVEATGPAFVFPGQVNGSLVTATFAVNPGDTGRITVGGQGTLGSGAAGGAGGFNGGGPGGDRPGPGGGPGDGGSGATDLRWNGSALGDRLVVAGGAGGNGFAHVGGLPGGAVILNDGVAGDGGGGVATADGKKGEAGATFNDPGTGGAGGTTISHPPGGDGTDGAAGQGGIGGDAGSGNAGGGGGGGGGYFGGGGGGGGSDTGNGGGGSGGTSFVDGSAAAFAMQDAGDVPGHMTVTLTSPGEPSTLAYACELASSATASGVVAVNCGAALITGDGATVTDCDLSGTSEVGVDVEANGARVTACRFHDLTGNYGVFQNGDGANILDNSFRPQAALVVGIAVAGDTNTVMNNDFCLSGGIGTNIVNTGAGNLITANPCA